MTQTGDERQAVRYLRAFHLGCVKAIEYHDLLPWLYLRGNPPSCTDRVFKYVLTDEELRWAISPQVWCMTMSRRIRILAAG